MSGAEILTFVVLTWMWEKIGGPRKVFLFVAVVSVWCLLYCIQVHKQAAALEILRSRHIAPPSLPPFTSTIPWACKYPCTSLPTLTPPRAASFSDLKQDLKVTYLHLLVCYLQARLIMEPRRCIRVTPG
jgi:hypothetical protein